MCYKMCISFNTYGKLLWGRQHKFTFIYLDMANANKSLTRYVLYSLENLNKSFLQLPSIF